jgi:hypothetical protein
MDSESELVAKALAAYQAAQADALAGLTSLPMAEWMATGRPPSAAELRGRGFTAENTEHLSDMRLARRAAIARWGHSIPCAEAVAALSRHGPWVEIGAGSGYWAALLRAAGLDAVATDLKPWGAEVEALDGVTAVRTYAKRDVFCSWPTRGGDWIVEAAASMAPGRILAVIADGRDGEIASPALYDLLDAEFTIVEEILLPQWPGARDRLMLHRRG